MLPRLLGAQATAIYQNMPAFHSPYTGEDSLRFDHGLDHDTTRTYGVYFGSRVTEYLQAYADFEMFQGARASATGSASGGYTNGDVIRAGPANLGSDPYLARLYARVRHPPVGRDGRAERTRAMDQMPGREPRTG